MSEHTFYCMHICTQQQTVSIEYESNHKPEYQQDQTVNPILQHHKPCQSDNNSNMILNTNLVSIQVQIIYVTCEEHDIRDL